MEYTNMYALIEGKDGESYFQAVIVLNQYGVYRWKYKHEKKSVIGESFSNLDDAVCVLRESRLKWPNPKAEMLVVDGTSISVSLTDIDYRDPPEEEPTPTAEIIIEN